MLSVFNMIQSDEKNYKQRINMVRIIIQQAKGRKYNLLGKGPGSQFSSFTMNYQYLLWLRGNEPVSRKEKLQFIISETLNHLSVEKKGIMQEL